MATYAGAAKGPAPPPAGYKRILDDFENDEMYVKYKNKRLRVVYEDDLPPVLLRTRKPRTFMIMTDEVEEKAWRNPYGTAFEGHLRNGADGALRPDAYISVSNNTGLGNMVEDELWANRNAGNMIHKLCERIDWLNEKFGWLRQRAIDADAQAEKLRQEITRLKTGGNDSKEGDKYLDFFRHVRYRTMIQFAHNRGYMDKSAPFQDWGGPDRLFNRLRLLSNMMHGGDLRSDVALADSDYLQQYQNEPPIKFYLPMFEKIYMTPIGLARWLINAADKHYEAQTWINLIDRYVYATDSTLNVYFDKQSSSPLMNDQRVMKVFGTMDGMYRRWISLLQVLMADSKRRYPNPRAAKPLANLDIKAVTQTAEQICNAGEKMDRWVNVPGQMWVPGVKWQRRYDHVYFKNNPAPP